MRIPHYTTVALLLLLVSGCTRPSTPPPDLDTSGQACTSHADCRCQGFDGVEFLPQAVPGACDLSTGRCVQCTYR